MKCPLCQVEMLHRKTSHYAQYEEDLCVAPDCINKDMPRYIRKYHPNGDVCYEEFMVGKYFVRVLHTDNQTIISELKASMYFTIITLPKAIIFNLENKEATVDKLNLLVTFS